MAICGIVVRLAQAPAQDVDTLALLAEIPGLTLGAPADRKVPGVLETPTSHDDHDRLERVAALPGVVGVDLVCVHYDEDMGADALGEVVP